MSSYEPDADPYIIGRERLIVMIPKDPAYTGRPYYFVPPVPPTVSSANDATKKALFDAFVAGLLSARRDSVETKGDSQCFEEWYAREYSSPKE